MRDPFPFGARVRLPFAQVGLIVDCGPSRHIRRVAWIGPMRRPVEALLPTGCLTLLALPLPTTPKG